MVVTDPEDLFPEIPLLGRGTGPEAVPAPPRLTCLPHQPRPLLSPKAGSLTIDPLRISRCLNMTSRLVPLPRIDSVRLLLNGIVSRGLR